MSLPKINELFALLKGVKYFIALDLWSCYYHIKLDEESILESAFTTVFGKFEFLRLPFGLSQGPDFQGQGSGYLGYLDDILIYRRNEKDHQQMLDKAFKH